MEKKIKIREKLKFNTTINEKKNVIIYIFFLI